MTTQRLHYFNNQELPAWVVDDLKDDTGTQYDMSSGWTFTVTLARTTAPATALAIKSTGITASATAITVAWSASDWSGLEAAVNGTPYVVLLQAVRTSDSYSIAYRPNNPPTLQLKAAPGTSAVSPNSYPITVTAASVTFTPTGSISSTDVQAAITELDVDEATVRTTYPAVGSGFQPRQGTTTTIEDFQTLTGWTVTTPTADTTNFVRGTQGGQLTSTSGALTSAVKALTLDTIRGKHFEVSFYIEDYTKVEYVRFAVTTVAGDTGWQWEYRVNRNGWHRASFVFGNDEFPVGVPSTTLNFLQNEEANFLMIRLKALAGQTTTCTFGEINTVESPLARGIMLISFDDNRQSILTKALPIMRARNLVGTVFIATSNLGATAPDGGVGYSLAGVQTLHEHGWAVGGHSATHPDMTGLTAIELRNELETSYNWLVDNGFEPRSMAWPYGAANNTTATEARRWFELNRTVGGANFAFPFRGFGSDLEPETLPSLELTTAQLSSILTRIQVAAYMRHGCSVFLHDVGNTYYGGTEISEADFTTFCDAIVTADLETLTFNDLVDGATKLSDRARTREIMAAVYPSNIFINPMGTAAGHSGWSTVTQQSTHYFGGRRAAVGVSAGSYVYWNVAMRAGTWTLDLFHRQDTANGIYSVQIDGVTVGTIDGYAAAPASTLSSISFTVSTSGVHELRLAMLTKNASATQYAGLISGINMIRTA